MYFPNCSFEAKLVQKKVTHGKLNILAACYIIEESSWWRIEDGCKVRIWIEKWL